MISSSFLWKQDGTTCENLLEGNQVLAAMRCVADLAAPSVVFASEGPMPPNHDRAAPTFRLGYNDELATAVWDALATGDNRFLQLTLAQHFPLPPGLVWLTYLRTHENLSWVFSDDDIRRLGADPAAHRQYLTEYYTGQFAGSNARGVSSTVSGGGIAGTLASLAGLEKAIEEIDPAAIEIACRRILAAWAVVLGTGGVPVIYLGDELGQLGEQHFDPDRFQRGRAGEGPEGMVLSGIRRLLEVRRSIPDFGPMTIPVVFDVGDRRVIAFHGNGATVVVNLAPDSVVISREALPADDLFDQITADFWDGQALSGYEYRFLLA
jgi:hypothetical protein